MVHKSKSKKPKLKSQRQRILDAATQLLAAKGAEGLRVRDVATAADCSTMGVYSHFGGKHGLVEAIFIDGFERIEATLRDVEAAQVAAPAAQPATLSLERSGLAYRDWAFDNPGAYAVMFAGAVPGFEPSDDALAVALHAFLVLTECVEEAQQSGEIAETDTYLVAHTLWALLHGLVMIEFAHMVPNGELGARADGFFVASMHACIRGFG